MRIQAKSHSRITVTRIEICIAKANITENSHQNAHHMNVGGRDIAREYHTIL